ncbi:MAG: PqqD family peptide modification chaperone [Dongiaceae bacterium]
MSGQRLRIAGPEILAEVIDGEAIIMDLSKGGYYSLDRNGAAIWVLLAAGADPAEAAAAIAARYGVAPERAAADLAAIAGQLVAEGLLRPRAADEPPAPAPALELPAAGYETPILNKYGDMKDLLAFDPPIPEFSDLGER